MHYTPIIQSLKTIHDHQVDVLRLDLLDEEISGNKWFKLKHNIQLAQSKGLDHLVTFGGAYSNHIAATAAACKKFGMRCTGIIRGEEETSLNATLSRAKEQGMNLHFVSREMYAKKTSKEFLNYLEELVGDHYLVPEGGNNDAGIRGCAEILDPEWEHDYVFCACGTAATYTGLAASVNAQQTLIGISVLKGENNLPDEVNSNLKTLFPKTQLRIKNNDVFEKKTLDESCISNAYAFKGYAKLDPHLVVFKEEFEAEHKIPLDHVYTTKLFYAVFDLMKQKKLKSGSSVLVIHSGGLQGNAGFENRYHLMPKR